MKMEYMLIFICIILLPYWSNINIINYKTVTITNIKRYTQGRS